MTNKLSSLLYCVFLFAVVGGQTLPKGSGGSDVWGLKGEKWNKELLLDWSWSGYGGKEREYPDPPVVANILDYGAKGDGRYDNSGPIAAAIAAAKSKGGGSVLIPAGKFLVAKRIVIDGNGVVLKGAGRENTRILFPRSLAELDNHDPSGISAESPYSWEDGWLQIKGLDTGSSDPTTRIGAITSAAPIGSRKLTISSLYGVKVGQWVRVIMSDVNGELVKTLYGDIVSRGCGDRFAKENCVADIIGEADLVRWMVRVTAIDGNTITLQRPLPVPVDPSWKAQLHKVPDSMVKEAGIRDITIEFPWTPAADHLREAGYNAVFVSGAVNAFVTNVAVINVDTGFMVSQSTHVSVDGVSVSTSKPRGQSLPFDGHIGIGAYDSTDIEFGNFDIRGEWTHDVTVRGTLMVVAHNGRGDNLNLDSHRSAPYATLYSNLYLGDGTRPYGTGGALSRGYPTARFTTYYNIRNGKWRAIDVPAATMSGACTWGSGVTAVGYWTGDINCPGYHVESYQYGSLEPVDLYGSMIDRKYSTRATTELLPEPPAPVAAPTTANKPPAPPTPASPPTEAVPDPAPVPEEAPMPSKVSLLPPTLSPTSAPTPAAEGPAPAAVSVHAVQKVQTFEVPSAQDSVPEPAGDGTYPVISAPETY